MVSRSYNPSVLGPCEQILEGQATPAIQTFQSAVIHRPLQATPSVKCVHPLCKRRIQRCVPTRWSPAGGQFCATEKGDPQMVGSPQAKHGWLAKPKQGLISRSLFGKLAFLND